MYAVFSRIETAIVKSFGPIIVLLSPKCPWPTSNLRGTAQDLCFNLKFQPNHAHLNVIIFTDFEYCTTHA